MSSVSSAGVTAALPFLSLHGHAHRKGSPVQASSGTDALTGADSSADAAPATNQGIFSSLLQTAEKLVGVQLTAPTAVPTKSPVSAGTPGAPVAPLAGPTAPALPLVASAPPIPAPVDPSATVGNLGAPVVPVAGPTTAPLPVVAAAPNGGIVQALAKLQLLTNSGSTYATQTAVSRRIDTTA